MSQDTNTGFLGRAVVGRNVGAGEDCLAVVVLIVDVVSVCVVGLAVDVVFSSVVGDGVCFVVVVLVVVCFSVVCSSVVMIFVFGDSVEGMR